MSEFEWRQVFEFKNNKIMRFTATAKVDGGHLYHDSIHSDGNVTNTMCFVPDVDLSRYQSHLRDAYKKGFDDGLQDGQATHRDVGLQCQAVIDKTVQP